MKRITLCLVIFLLIFNLSVLAQKACIRKITFTVLDKPVSGEDLIILSFTDKDKIDKDIEIFPQVIIIGNPKYEKETKRLLGKFYPPDEPIEGLAVCFYLDPGFRPIPEDGIKKIRIRINTNSDNKSIKIPETLSYSYLTLSGKQGTVIFNTTSDIIPVPEIVEIHEENGLVHLSWAAVNLPAGLKGYNLYRKINGSKKKKIAVLLKNTSYKEKIEIGGRYCYAVSAVSNEGKESELSKWECLECSKFNSNIITYPNPASKEITFRNLPKGAVLKIYNINSEEVFRTKLGDKTSYRWALKNKAGEKLSSGIYLYTVHSENFKKNGKIVILK